MSHEAHHDTHHTPADTKPNTSYYAAFWFVVIIAGLFVAAVNFVNVMSNDDEGGHGAGGHATEHTTEHGGAATHEATPAHATEAQGTEHAEAAPTADTTHAHEAASH
jgi:hypothetical protein